MEICFHFVCFFVLNSRRNRLNGYWRILVVLLQAGEPNHLYIGQGHRSEAIIIIRSTVNTIGNLCFATVAGEMILQWVPLYFIRLWDDDMNLLFVETLLTFSSCCVSGTASPLPWFTSGQGHVSTSIEEPHWSLKFWSFRWYGYFIRDLHMIIILLNRLESTGYITPKCVQIH